MGSVQMALAGIFGTILGGFYNGMAYGFGNCFVWIFWVGIAFVMIRRDGFRLVANDIGRNLHLKIGLGEACVDLSAVDFDSDPVPVIVLENFDPAG